MKKLFSIASLFLCVASHSYSQQTSPVDQVNTLMGSDSEFKLSNGNTYPAIALPWGMNFWTPQTGKMGDQPNLKPGIDDGDFPYSMTMELKKQAIQLALLGSPHCHIFSRMKPAYSTPFL